MKASKSLLESLDMAEVKGTPDMRRLLSNGLLAALRGDLPASQVELMCKTADSISRQFDIDFKKRKSMVEIRKLGGKIAGASGDEFGPLSTDY